jgi:hypothetical protein
VKADDIFFFFFTKGRKKIYKYNAADKLMHVIGGNNSIVKFVFTELGDLVVLL